jgi:signal transduction histidine kinase
MMYDAHTAVDLGLRELAPATLPNFRVHRYHGDELCVRVAELAPRDQERVRALYRSLSRLLATLSDPDRESSALFALASALGRESYEINPTIDLAKALHDIRGGGLTPLLGQLQAAEDRGVTGELADSLFNLARDHLKIMRNALLGLDDAGRDRDLRPRPHGTGLILEKWHGTVLHAERREVRLEVDCPIDVAIGECCLEFGALDRILYNLISNAFRHAATELIQLFIFPVPRADGENLRFVVVNHAEPAALAQVGAAGAARLFEEGVSTTGSGYGLSIVRDFVTHAYGLRGHAEAIEGGYVGAKIESGLFLAWFHWPRLLRT